MTSTLDEASVLSGLYATLRELLPVDTLEMVTLPEGTDRARYMQMVGDSLPTSRWLTARSAHTVTARDVVAGNKPVLAHYPHSSLWVPLKESGGARGALGINFSRPYAYEASTGAFMELVADEVTLSLRNARSYEAIEDQRRRLEVVNAVGRRLASSLDRWSIMRTLREELSANLKFDGFILATITDGPDGPIAEGYQYVAGVEEVVPPVALAVTAPSRRRACSVRCGPSAAAPPFSSPARRTSSGRSPAPSSGCRCSAANASPPCSRSSPTPRARSTTGTSSCCRTWRRTSAWRWRTPTTSPRPRRSERAWNRCTCSRWAWPERPTSASCRTRCSRSPATTSSRRTWSWPTWTWPGWSAGSPPSAASPRPLSAR